MTEPTDFSQSGEQAAILQWADGRAPGRFLDLGAGDGVGFSNTRALALRGWGGVCVEAAAWAFDLLSDLYAKATAVECVQAAVTADECGLRPFWLSRGDHLSSLEPGQARRWPEVRFEQVTVAAVPLPDLLDHFAGGFEFASIDTEGSSVELVRVYRQHPAWEALQLVCVEAVDLAERREVARVCTAWAEVAVTPNNMVLAR